MGDFTQPQQKFAGTGENRNIAILVILYPVINMTEVKSVQLGKLIYC